MGVYIIAEAGVNHNGNTDLARKLIDMAVECGADAIKFQTFKAHESTAEYAEKADYQKNNTDHLQSQYEMIKALELKFEDFFDLVEYAKEKNIDFISTPDGEESLNFLLKLDMPYIKVGSTEVTNHRFLRKIGESGKRIILSTGMSTLAEVDEALRTIYSTGNRTVDLMHCTTAYPTDLEEVNILAIETMAKAFKVHVGYSDHTLTSEAAIAAVALGSRIIEKHITLDNNMEGPDHQASMGPEAFKCYIDSIRNVEKLLGSGIKEPSNSEMIIKQTVRRSILFAKDLQAGTIVTDECFEFKRPGTGLEPKFVSLLIGRELKATVLKDQMVNLSHFT